MRVIILVFIVLIPILSSSQIEVIASYFEDYNESFCSDRIELHSDSSFYYEWGCESRAAFIMGKFTKNNDTIYLHRATPSEKNLIDSISFSYSNETTDTLSISFYSINNNKFISDVYIANQNEYMNWVDSLKKPNENVLVRKFTRSREYYFKNGKHAEPSIYYKGWEYIKKTDSLLYLCLHNFALSTGNRKVIPIPQNAIEIRIYTRFPDNLVKNNHMYDYKKYSGKSSDSITIKNQVFTITN